MQKPKQQKRNLTSRVVKLQVDKFISNREHCILTAVKQDTGKLNQSGFVEILQGGMKSTDRETLQINMPPQIDLSIHQDGGFSIFLWLICSKTASKDKSTSYILKKGSTVDQITPTIGLTFNQTKLFVSLKTSKSKKETIFANKPLEADHFYSLAVTFAIDYESQSTEVSIYLDGKLDTQSTIQGEPIHNQGCFYLGRADATCHGFKGSVADVIIVPSLINENEVKMIHEYGLEGLLETDGKDIRTRYCFQEIFDRKRLISKYAQYTNKPEYQVEKLGLSNERMLEVVKTYDKDERDNYVPPIQETVNVKEEVMKENMKLFMTDDDNEIRCYKILDNQKFINTILYLANKGETRYELIRLTKIFYTLSDVLVTVINDEFLYNLCKILCCISSKKFPGRTKTETIIKYYIDKDKMFTNLEHMILLIEEEQRLIDEENAKYAKKKGTKKKGGSIKSLYAKGGSQKPESAGKSFHHTHGQYQASLEKYQTFGSCIPQHEDLLLRSQPIKNTFDEEEEKALKDYHSNYVIKTLYEKPKNLPGIDPNNTSLTILDRTLTKVNDEEENDEDDNQKLSLEDEKKCEEFLTSIFAEYELSESKFAIDIDTVDTYEKAEQCEKFILDDRQKEKEKEEEKEKAKKRKEEEEKKKLEGSIIDDKKDQKQATNFDPEFPKDWADGAFEVVVNYCHNCIYGHRNKTEGDDKKKEKGVTKSTRHYEFSYIDKFNDLGDHIKGFFPNAIIVGNLDEADYLSNFDVYLRGTGLPGDEKGRYFIYRKKDNNLKFPSNEDVIDQLVALTIIFGGSKNIEKTQTGIIKETVRLPITKDYPANLDEDVAKEKEQATKAKPQSDFDPDRTKLCCLNWGCGALYTESENKGKKQCRYHCGSWQFGSYNRYWPECWSCCEGKWDSPGCCVGYHRGVRQDRRIFLCLNHGEPNPVTGRPDSACGIRYTEKSPEGCVYHSGYFDSEKKRWTCCSDSDRTADGCVKGNHETKLYPEEDAKLYFITKFLINPGLLHGKEAANKWSPADYIINSDYFKDAKKYPNYKELHEERKQRIENNKKEKRLCMNNCCGKEFIENESKPGECRCHPGTFVFGYTSNSIKRYVRVLNEVKEEEDKDKKLRDNRKYTQILYSSHWTCCGGAWDSTPCYPKKEKRNTYLTHRGPLLKSIPEDKMPKYKWPDERLKLSFKMEVSDRWKKFLDTAVVKDEEQIRKAIDDMLKIRNKRKNRKELINAKEYFLTLSDFVNLCETFKLGTLAVQEDPSYLFKFLDVVEYSKDGMNQKSNLKFLLNSDRNIDVDKFIEWWFLDYETIYNTCHPELQPKKEEKKEEAKK